MFLAQMLAPVPPSLKKDSRVLVINGIIMVSRAHNMCKPGLDPIDCKSSSFNNVLTKLSICSYNLAVGLQPKESMMEMMWSL